MQLSTHELRVLGSLMEKEITTPDIYPLSLNALQAAANQRSSRDPVLDLAEDDLRQALTGPLVIVLTRQPGSREVRYAHLLGDLPAAAPPATFAPPSTEAADAVATLSAEVATLERRVTAFEERLRRLEDDASAVSDPASTTYPTSR